MRAAHRSEGSGPNRLLRRASVGADEPDPLPDAPVERGAEVAEPEHLVELQRDDGDGGRDGDLELEFPDRRARVDLGIRARGLHHAPHPRRRAGVRRGARARRPPRPARPARLEAGPARRRRLRRAAGADWGPNPPTGARLSSPNPGDPALTLDATTLTIAGIGV